MIDKTKPISQTRDTLNRRNIEKLSETNKKLESAKSISTFDISNDDKIVKMNSALFDTDNEGFDGVWHSDGLGNPTFTRFIDQSD